LEENFKARVGILRGLDLVKWIQGTRRKEAGTEKTEMLSKIVRENRWTQSALEWN
jgi:hypothetical protein